MNGQFSFVLRRGVRVHIACLIVTGRIHAAKVLPPLKYHGEHIRYDTLAGHIILTSNQSLLFSFSKLTVLCTKCGLKKYHILSSPYNASPELKICEGLVLTRALVSSNIRDKISTYIFAKRLY